LLRAWSSGDEAALARLTPLVEAELHRLAASFLRRERPGHTLQTTALFNEAYLRLIGDSAVEWQNRTHFFGIAAQDGKDNVWVIPANGGEARKLTSNNDPRLFFRAWRGHPMGKRFILENKRGTACLQ